MTQLEPILKYLNITCIWGKTILITLKDKGDSSNYADFIYKWNLALFAEKHLELCQFNTSFAPKLDKYPL